jgi:hypothetical protein
MISHSAIHPDRMNGTDNAGPPASSVSTDRTALVDLDRIPIRCALAASAYPHADGMIATTMKPRGSTGPGNSSCTPAATPAAASAAKNTTHISPPVRFGQGQGAGQGSAAIVPEPVSFIGAVSACHSGSCFVSALQKILPKKLPTDFAALARS